MAIAASGQLLYGKYEQYSGTTAPQLPQLDACGGSYGVTPDSDGKVVYHYHTQEHPPFSLGCVGQWRARSTFTGCYHMAALTSIYYLTITLFSTFSTSGPWLARFKTDGTEGYTSARSATC